MANLFDDDVFDFEATGASGRSRIDRDREINEKEIYNEKSIYRNANNNSAYDYAQGKTKKRKKKVNFKRGNEINMDGEEEDQMADFDSRKNPNYEDAYTKENLLGVQKDMDMTSEDKEKFKSTISSFITKKKKIKLEQDMSALKDSNNLGDFLKSVNRAKKQAENLVNSNEDWLFSNKRNKDKIKYSKHNKKSLENSDENSDENDLLKKKIKIKNTNKDWFEERMNEDQKVDKKDLGNNDIGVEDQEYEIKVKRSEFNYMKELTKKMYGKSIDEDQYLEMVSQKFTSNDKKNENIPNFDISKELETLNDDYVADLDLEDTFDVQKDSQKIKKSSAAISGDNIIPQIDWELTPYAKFSADKVRKINPFRFILNIDTKEELMDDDKLFLPLDCAMKKLLLNTNDQEKIFKSIKEWFAYIQMCDVYHTETKTYRYLGKSDSKNAFRLVIYHDLKNGFFICNHFELQKKNGTRDDEKKFEFIWLNYCYLECINRRE